MTGEAPLGEQRSLEEQAAFLLFCRGHHLASVRRLAHSASLPLQLAETLLCRALSTLVRRGYPAAGLCEFYTLTPEQLARAAQAPPFGPEFKPLGIVWRKTRVVAPRAPVVVAAAPRLAAATEPETIGEDELVAELTALLALPAGVAIDRDISSMF